MIRASFPRGQTLASTQVLDKLETITPGWRQWAERVQTGDLQSIDLAPVKSRHSGALTH
ncbi:MAG TPA: hypothetical protein VGE92_11595 [Steroidobacteraceae bacterium]